ncbi:MAG: Crp/Fnr family transcriptional regulator [Spirochaetales bacterium]|nr:Crp/Fnr family transcriptional regulator [Spirochaetales bacterium]
MIEEYIKILTGCPLFSGLDETDLAELLESVPSQILAYDSGNLLMIRGDEYTSLKILLEGEVSAEIQDFDGRTIKIENLKAPDALATGILFADDNTLPVTLVAQNPVKLMAIKKDDVIRLAQSNSRFLVNYFSDSGNKVAFLAEKIRLFQFKSLKEKFAGYILSLSSKQKSDIITLPYSREKLAELFAVARPSLSRTCSELADEGILRLKGKTVEILRREVLRQIIDS